MVIKPSSAPYNRQTLALAPFTETIPETELLETLIAMAPEEKRQFHELLTQNNLCLAWIEAFGWKALERVWPKTQMQILKVEAKRIMALYLRQISAIKEISDLLEQQAIRSAVFKGTHTRELVYTNPAARPALDIDILIDEQERSRAIQLFTAQGYELHTKVKNLTHEATLTQNGVSIDLHWHILRPGRILKTLTPKLLDNRVRHPNYYSLSSEDHLFVLLVHPVFTKYSSTTQFGLIRILDLVFWIKKQAIQWEEIVSLLEQTGLKSAAWITLEYLRIITGVSPPPHVIQHMAPGKIRERYLRKWIHGDLPGRFEHWPLAVKLGFTLLAHDRLKNLSDFARLFFVENRKNTCKKE
jgi:hypothetical protein